MRGCVAGMGVVQVSVFKEGGGSNFFLLYGVPAGCIPVCQHDASRDPRRAGWVGLIGSIHIVQAPSAAAVDSYCRAIAVNFVPSDGLRPLMMPQRPQSTKKQRPSGSSA